MVLPRWARSLRFVSMESAIYGIAFAIALVVVTVVGYVWYLTPGRHDRLE